MVRENKGGYRSGEVKNLYNNWIRHNLDTFCHSIVNGVYDFCLNACVVC